MKKRTNKPVDQLINDINGTKNPYYVPLEQVFQETDEDLKAEYIPDLKQRALSTVAAYKKRQDEIAYGGTLSEAVYYFMNGRLWEDSVLGYSNAAVAMMTALADGTFNQMVKDKIGHNITDLVKLLNKTIGFMRNIEMSCIEPLMVMQDIKNHDYSEKDLQDIIDEYEARLQMSVFGKY
jgi:hypothetical protein